MNIVALTGFLASEVDLRRVKVGGEEKSIAEFTLGVNRTRKDAGADFPRVAAWGKTGEICAEYLKKGSRISVIGAIQTSRYTSPDGKPVNVVKVIASRVEFLSRMKEEESTIPSGFAPISSDIMF